MAVKKSAKATARPRTKPRAAPKRPKSNPALMHAARARSLTNVQQLLAEGASPDSAENGYSALMAASSAWQSEIVAALLEAGANPNKGSKLLGTPLICAAGSLTEGNLLETVRLLLASGADITAMDGDGNTALHKACSNGHTAMVEMLLAAGADVRMLNREGRLPAEGAVWRGHTDIVRLLIDRAGAIASVDDALVFAASQGQLSLVQLLLQRGANPNHQAPKYLQYSALGVAAYSGWEEVIRTLLAAGADPSRPGNQHGDSPRAIAVERGQSGAAKLLGA
ncbi:ankyrin repeat domain-containing protein [Corallococcus exercitus]|uniref:ankyrin repeat domain-containing protein n=1 Tax=Corallococcus exercitus TaxID=2316736 RepID=UPI0035D48F79